MTIEPEDNSAAPPSPHEHVVFTELDDAQGVLVDLNSKQYYQLNATASFIWRGLARRTSPVEIARDLTAVYDVTFEHAQSSVATAMGRFIAHHLVKVSR